MTDNLFQEATQYADQILFQLLFQIGFYPEFPPFGFGCSGS
jgi:hypothetical protein